MLTSRQPGTEAGKGSGVALGSDRGFGDGVGGVTGVVGGAVVGGGAIIGGAFASSSGSSLIGAVAVGATAAAVIGVGGGAASGLLGRTVGTGVDLVSGAVGGSPVLSIAGVGIVAGSRQPKAAKDDPDNAKAMKRFKTTGVGLCPIDACLHLTLQGAPGCGFWTFPRLIARYSLPYEDRTLRSVLVTKYTNRFIALSNSATITG